MIHEPPALVVLDMAGTTVEDDGQVPAAFLAALADHGIDAPPDAIANVRGASKRHAILHFIPDGPARAARADAAYADFKRHLTRRYAEGVREVDGAERVVRELRRQGIRVALNTGFDRDITAMLLDALRWTDLADATVCGDDVATGRPAPDLIFKAMHTTRTPSHARVANVGDTALDLQAGANARCTWNVGVLSGAHARDRLAREPHTHLLPSVAELMSIWS